jgi:hypothetical protein
MTELVFDCMHTLSAVAVWMYCSHLYIIHAMQAAAACTKSELHDWGILPLVVILLPILQPRELAVQWRARHPVSAAGCGLDDGTGEQPRPGDADTAGHSPQLPSKPPAAALLQRSMSAVLLQLHNSGASASQTTPQARCRIPTFCDGVKAKEITLSNTQLLSRRHVSS